jgi:hypothetical protein
MSESMTLVAAVLVSLALGVGVCALFWWLSLRRQSVASVGAASASATNKPPLIMIAVAIGLLASVLVLYLIAKSDNARKREMSTEVAAPTAELNALASALGMKGVSGNGSQFSAPTLRNEPKGGDLDVMTARLEKRLKESTPDDYSGWALLARSYVELGRDADAIAAYERTGPLLKSDAAIAAEFAELKKHVTGSPSIAQSSAVAPNTPLVSGKIDIDVTMRQKLPTTGVVFVVARVPGQTGAPLAAQRIELSKLPIAFALTDSDSMLPGQKLSSAKTIEIVARVSATGEATAQPGDLESKKQSVESGRRDIELKLSSQR